MANILTSLMVWPPHPGDRNIQHVPMNTRFLPRSIYPIQNAVSSLAQRAELGNAIRAVAALHALPPIRSGR